MLSHNVFVPAIGALLFGVAGAALPSGSLGANIAPASSASESPLRTGPAYHWQDFDRDLAQDVYVQSPTGEDRLLHNVGGRFEDVTATFGLGGRAGTQWVTWVDFDGDQLADLFLIDTQGKARLLHNAASGFMDVTEDAGLAKDWPVYFAEWADIDADGRVDAHLLTPSGDQIFKNLGAGRFERGAPLSSGSLPLSGNPGASGVLVGDRGLGSTSVLNPSCMRGILDAANTAACLQASSTPVLGDLYPISNDFFVSGGGDVGIGTTSPTQRLDVAGMIRSRSGGIEFPDATIQSTAQLVGPQGPAGAAGADGADGIDGAPGAQGPAGADGADGADGAAGAQGPAGNDGADGAMGLQGPAGADGADGAQGPAGNDGATGPAGADGADGAQGPAGNDGATGAQGPQGTQGIQGTQGPIGPAGASPWGLDGGNNTTYTAGQVLVGTVTPNAANTMSVVGTATNGVGASNALATSVALRGDSTGTGASAGVQGTSTSSTGFGVLGTNNVAGGNGVRGTTSTAGALGVFGVNTSTGASPIGIQGQASLSTSGVGIFGSGGVQGVQGSTASTTGVGVFGIDSSATTGTGVQGQTSSATSGTGVVGFATATTAAASGFAVGVAGQSNNSNGTGVNGIVNAATGTAGPWGVNGQVNGSGGTTIGTSAIGVRGSATSTSVGTNFRCGVYGEVTTAAANAFAGYFLGNVNVTGTLSKGGGTFKIDHPLDPEHKILYHSFVESPDMMNVYNGVVVAGADGQAVVELPSYFEALNKDFRYQLTCVGGFAPVFVAEEVRDNHFTIAGARPGLKVSWQVTGIRKDPFAEQNRVVPEVDKLPSEQGLYLYPAAYGLTPDRGINQISPKVQAMEQATPLMPADGTAVHGR